MLLYSCKYCGRLHTENYKCPKKPPKPKKSYDDIVRFRSGPDWQKKRLIIKERDNYLCQICIRELYGTIRKYNYKDLQVHHAIPISEDEGLKLEDSNLITLCPMHHAMCDKGQIPYNEIKKIINEQQKKNRVYKVALQCE